MGREIKFRSYTPSGMVEIDKIVFKTGMAYFEDVLRYQGIDMEEFPLMQYTGLKDKDGKEIYEGDIVESFRFDDPEFRSEVFYKNGAFGYKSYVWEVFISFASNENYKWRDDKSENIKVIGNIYENPELLEVE
jgi:uncharacterized phage protein (TIGR01671 family)